LPFATAPVAWRYAAFLMPCGASAPRGGSGRRSTRRQEGPGAHVRAPRTRPRMREWEPWTQEKLALADRRADAQDAAIDAVVRPEQAFGRSREP
jgi:hypothetical protein